MAFPHLEVSVFEIPSAALDSQSKAETNPSLPSQIEHGSATELLL
jgi:hypothetical protein